MPAGKGPAHETLVREQVHGALPVVQLAVAGLELQAARVKGVDRAALGPEELGHHVQRRRVEFALAERAQGLGRLVHGGQGLLL